MRKRNLTRIIAIIALLTAVVTLEGAGKDCIDIAAGELGKSRSSLCVDPAYKSGFRVGSSCDVKLFGQFLDKPVSSVKTVRSLVNDVTPGKTIDPAEMIVGASKYLDHKIDKIKFDSGKPEKSGPERLAAAIDAVCKARGGQFSDADSVKELPAALCDGAAEVLEAVAASLPLLDEAFKSIPKSSRSGYIQTGTYPTVRQPGPSGWESAMRSINYEKLFEAGARVCHSVVTSGTAMAKAKPKIKSDFKCSTPLGDIVIVGSKGDKHTFGSGDILLFIETGGSDEYSGPKIGANSSARNTVSIVMDLSGNDEYKSPGGLNRIDQSQGAGVLGIGILADFGGNDEYEGGVASQGACAYGVGMLYDGGKGKDQYKSFGISQGAGFCGIGMLIDEAGNDKYTTSLNAQGYGATKGLGLLMDVSGNDIYIATDPINGNPLIPAIIAAQGKGSNDEHNNSMCQGAAAGWREKSLAAGIGLLCDIKGDDQYSCGVFGQGVGLCGGIGILNDSDGKDQYKGVWYVQGAGCHTGYGMLHDRKGNDKYWTKRNMSQGAGHDFSVGILIDEKGNDVHEFPNMSLGYGNDRGFGLFVDIEGNDVYSVLNNANLNVGETKQNQPSGYSTGIFVDAKGKDRYPRKNQGNNKKWKSKKGTGVGVDFDKGKVKLW
ncbi:MAG: hypothetical protein ACYS8W_13200 [Planctomycetota bacterium]|jgi:hypothetical protein